MSAGPYQVERISISVMTTSRRDNSSSNLLAAAENGHGTSVGASASGPSGSRRNHAGSTYTGVQQQQQQTPTGAGAARATVLAFGNAPFYLHPYMGLVITAYTLLVLAFFGLTVLGEVTMQAVSVVVMGVAFMVTAGLLARYLPAILQASRRHRHGMWLFGPGGPQRWNADTLVVHSRLSLARLQMAIGDRELDPNDYDILRALDDEDERFEGATQAEIDRLPTHVISHAEGGKGVKARQRSCPICLEPYCAGETLRTLPCLHQFHADCVDRWMARKAECPVCKFSTLG